MKRFYFKFCCSDKKEDSTTKLNRRASNLLTAILIVFIGALTVMIITVFTRTITKTSEIRLTIEELKSVNAIVPYSPNYQLNLEKEKVRQFNSHFLDSLKKFNENLNFKIKNIERIETTVKEIEGRNSDLFKIFLALIGSIFAIVGFFGFKSINDTRHVAIEKAVVDAKEAASSKAKEIAEFEAKRISNEIAKTVATEISQEEAKTTAKKEVASFFINDFEKQLSSKIDVYYNEREERLENIEVEIDKLINRDKYFVETKRTNELQSEIDELRAKYMEVLKLIEEIKLKNLKQV